jgi:signal transduction histidine kinase
VEATLMNHWTEGNDDVLELQSGFLAFRGRLESALKRIDLPPSGSRLELTGVYAAQGSRLSDGKVSGFELLLHSPADIRVLARSPWWNLRRVLILAAILGALLCLVLIWNKELHRKVQERTLQLEREIRNRQHAELQRAAEAERSRIARDLHDELGAGLTEVSLLASTGFSEFRGQKSGDDRFSTIAEKARALVSRLDVIVWAIDPTRNSLQSFADYVSSYANEFLAASGVVCRLKIPIECKAISLSGTARHNLFLAIKESLNNIIRHAGATEVELQLVQLDHRLEITVIDNGRGFERASAGDRHGLANIEHRLAALRGECRIESSPGKGTKIQLIVPLSGNPE